MCVIVDCLRRRCMHAALALKQALSSLYELADAMYSTYSCSTCYFVSSEPSISFQTLC